MRWVIRVFAVVVLLTTGFLILARRESSGAWIAFSSDRDGEEAVFLMTGDGESVRKISAEGRCARSPRWSNNGKWIAFLSCDSAVNVNLMRPSGADAHALTTGGSFGPDTQWSPDDEWLLTETTSSGMSIMRVDGSDETLISRDHRISVWSPDGEWIYARLLYTTDENTLDRIHVETGQVEPILGDKDNWFEPSLSPDGEHLVVVIFGPRGNDLYLLSPDGSSLEPVPDYRPMTTIADPRWSPDGEWIAFWGGPSMRRRSLYRVRPDGSDFQQLTEEEASARRYFWSPDSRWLVFVANPDGSDDIFRVRADGSIVENLTAGSSSDSWPHYAPISGLEWRPLWVAIASMMLLANLCL